MKQFYLPTKKRLTNRLALQLVPAAITLIALAVSIPLSAQTAKTADAPNAQTVTTFDAPGAGTGVGQGTYAFNISPSGTIIGWLRGADNVRHGFIRSKEGAFTIFDAPGAGTARWPGDAGLCGEPEWGHYRILRRLGRLPRAASFVTRTAQSRCSMCRERWAHFPPSAPF